MTITQFHHLSNDELIQLTNYTDNRLIDELVNRLEKAIVLNEKLESYIYALELKKDNK